MCYLKENVVRAFKHADNCLIKLDNTYINYKLLISMYIRVTGCLLDIVKPLLSFMLNSTSPYSPTHEHVLERPGTV